MSEKKDPNEINFDDEFLDIDFSDDTPNQNPTSPTDGQLPKSDTSSDVADEPTADSVTLSDVHLSTDTTTGIDLGNIEADLPDDDFLNQLDNLQQNPTTNPEPDTAGMGNAQMVAGAGIKPTKKGLGGLFGKKSTPKAPKSRKPAKSPKAQKPAKNSGDKGDLTRLLSDPKKLNKLILGGVIALALIGVALYMAMSGDDSSTVNTPAPVVSTPAPVQPNTPEPAPEQAETAPTETPDIDAADSILPNIKPVVNPDEILNAEIPTDPALIKEEIDRLADKDTQIAEQEKLIQDQLTLMEDLTTAKAEQIALLEAQIAELENQKNSTETTAPASGQ